MSKVTAVLAVFMRSGGHELQPRRGAPRFCAEAMRVVPSGVADVIVTDKGAMPIWNSVVAPAPTEPTARRCQLPHGELMFLAQVGEISGGKGVQELAASPEKRKVRRISRGDLHRLLE